MPQNQNALIIDDSPSIREYLQTILRNELNFRNIQVACCADEGIDILESDRLNGINWVICDWEMPGKPASDLFKYVSLKYSKNEVNTILLTGKTTHDARLLANDILVDDFLSKPFEPEALANKLKRLIGLKERRIAKRVNPYVPCEVDLGFDDYGWHGADLMNISKSGCLLTMRDLDDRYAHVNDITTLNFTFQDDSTLDVYAKIVRVERDEESSGNTQERRVAFEFKHQNEASIEKLQTYIDQFQLVLKSKTTAPD